MSSFKANFKNRRVFKLDKALKIYFIPYPGMLLIKTPADQAVNIINEACRFDFLLDSHILLLCTCHNSRSIRFTGNKNRVGKCRLDEE